MATFRQILKSGATLVINPSPTPTPTVTIWDDPSTFYSGSLPYIGPSPSVTATPSVTPPISPSVTPSVTVSPVYASGVPPTEAEFALANVYQCSITSIITGRGECGDYLGQEVIYRKDRRDYVVGLYYTGSDPAKIYQPVKQPYPYDANAIKVDSYSFDSCDQACTPAQCSSGSIVTFNPGGYISYITCAGNTVYVQLDCSGSYTINECHICSSIVGSTGPNGTGSPATITSITCGFDCTVPVSPSPTPSLTSSPTPSVTPTTTVTPTVTPTPTPSVTPTLTVSPTPSSTVPIVPTCSCPAGYTGSPDGTTCVSSSVTPATAITAVPSQFTSWGGQNVNWGFKGLRVYSDGTYNQQGTLQTGTYAYQSPNFEPFVSTGPFPQGSDLFWARRLNNIGVWARGNQFWPGTSNNNRNRPPYPGFLSLCGLVQIPRSGHYYIGLAADNRFVLRINGTTIVNQDEDVANFRYWNVYDVVLNAGPNLIEMGGWNESIWGTFGCEIYDNNLSQITSATSTASLNILFTTNNYLPARTVYNYSYPYTFNLNVPPQWSFSSTTVHVQGPSNGAEMCTNYTCPTGYTLDPTSNPSNPVCRRVDFLTNICAPSVTPSISVSPSVSITPTPTPTVTPSVSDTPCPTVSVSPTPSITVTPSPSYNCLDANCKKGYITNQNSYYYYSCGGIYVTGSNNGLATTLCVDISKPYSSNVGYWDVPSSTECFCCPPGTNHPYRYQLPTTIISGSVTLNLSQSLVNACSGSAILNANNGYQIPNFYSPWSDTNDLYSGSVIYNSQTACVVLPDLTGYYPYRLLGSTGTWSVAQFQNGVVISKPIC